MLSICALRSDEKTNQEDMRLVGSLLTNEVTALEQGFH